MPISEDEFDYNRSQEPQSTMSKAELRKTRKPIMEKRRRARINNCLSEIKTLLLEAMNKDPSRHSKLEKADILEMAVKFLQNVQRQHLALAMANDSSVLRKFKNGFNECASEIDKYMGQVDGTDSTIKQRVSSHLQKCIGGIEQVAQFNFPGFNNFPFIGGNTIITTTPNQAETASNMDTRDDQNNNPRIQIPQGIQLIPSRLPSGELALLVPNSSNMPYFPTAVNTSIQRSSAFATVIPQSTVADQQIPKPLSPPVSPISQDELRFRNPSPHGFRPVIPANKVRNYSEDHQVPQISSTVSGDKQQFSQPSEVKTLKFPINKFCDKDRKVDSSKKIVEPLCIITNQAERYKQAQMKEDFAYYEENVKHGVKRKFSETQGLLTVTQHDFSLPPPPKIIKTQLVTPTTGITYDSDSFSDSRSDFKTNIRAESFHRTELSSNPDKPCGSRDNNFDGNNDMWRPW
uniref:Deadpan n=1 Tax=Leptinotarsa decemlineata TaxID=7539 RepID=A0A0F7II93_LEPDE|nr:deadpan [Leptinotarsa decemlineata]